MKMFVSFAALSFAAALASAGTMTDLRDGHVYQTVQIGDQVWMAENLKYDVNDSYCYNHSDASCGELGPLYSMVAARNDVCPNGWKLPTEEDVLVMLGNVKNFAEEFKPQPGGFRTQGDDFYNIGTHGYFWTSTVVKNGKGKYFYWTEKDNSIKWLTGKEGSAMSVRCLKKARVSQSAQGSKAGSFTDPRDKRSYKTVQLNGKTWFAENLAYNTKESICFENKAANCEKFGRLYHLSDAKKACPAGWHLSTEEEYADLFSFFRPSEERTYCMFGGDVKTCEEGFTKERQFWRSITPRLEKMGFSTKTAGYRSYYYMEGDELHDEFRRGLALWSTIPTDMDMSNFMEFLPDGNVERVDEFGPYGCERSCGSNYFSVRCVQD